MSWLRHNSKYIVTAVVLLVFTFALVLFVNDYNGGSNDDVADPAGVSGPPSGPSPDPSGSSAGGSRSPGTPGAGLSTLPSTLPRLTISPQGPGGFVYKNIPMHTIELTATSSAPISGVGYLVPTSKDKVFGRVLRPGTSWSLATTAYGKPYYAALFVQATAAGVSVTCTITIDGQVASSETTKGGYGRQVCLA